MTDADNPTGVAGEPTAGTPEQLMIPKHRLDEALARIRELTDSHTQKDALLNQLAAQRQPQQQQPELNPEELGVDPQTMQAAVKIARHIVKQELGEKTKQINAMLVNVANTAEETDFLVRFGGGDAKEMKKLQAYLPKIKEHRLRHYQMTGMGMPIDMAFKLLRYEEMESRAPAQPATQTAPAQQAAPSAPADLPDASLSRMNPSPAAPSGGSTPAKPKTLEDEIAELEAQLSGGFASGHTA